MIISPCDEVCHECGFLNNSQKGVLKRELGLEEIIEKGVIFPCHLQLKAVTGCENEGVEEYVETVDTFKVCRGYVESMFISGRMKGNPVWEKIFAKLEGKINPQTMTIDETLAYHA
jgi:hypothetical protein